jgi:hypothetical protein
MSRRRTREAEELFVQGAGASLGPAALSEACGTGASRDLPRRVLLRRSPVVSNHVLCDSIDPGLAGLRSANLQDAWRQGFATVGIQTEDARGAVNG